MPKTLVINGHPDPESFCNAICESYVQGAQRSDNEVECINLRELDFELNLKYGYRKRTELEADLLTAQSQLKNADHLVWVYPVWWGSVPALMKGFLDRTLLPGFAFKKRENSLWWDQLFHGKSAHIICTMDQPTWYYKWIYGEPSTKAMKRLTLNFIGIKKIKTTMIGPIRLSTDTFRTNWLKKIEQMGSRNS